MAPSVSNKSLVQIIHLPGAVALGILLFINVLTEVSSLIVSYLFFQRSLNLA